MRLHNPYLTKYAKKLRKDMTPQERKIWYTFLRNLPYHISRQKVLGDYIVDFYCASAKLIIEIDGSQHYEDKGLAEDKIRDAYFSDKGYKVVRYTNLQVDTLFKNVCEDILRYLPHLSHLR